MPFTFIFTSSPLAVAKYCHLLYQLHWLKAPERIPTNSLFWHSDVCTGQCHRTSSTSSSGLRTLRSSSLIVIIITDCPSYTVVDCRRPSFSGRCCPCLERTTTSCNVCTTLRVFFSRLKTQPFIHSFPNFLWCP